MTDFLLIIGSDDPMNILSSILGELTAKATYGIALVNRTFASNCLNEKIQVSLRDRLRVTVITNEYEGDKIPSKWGTRWPRKRVDYRR